MRRRETAFLVSYDLLLFAINKKKSGLILHNISCPFEAGEGISITQEIPFMLNKIKLILSVSKMTCA